MPWSEDLAERYERGQPVLVGTISVENSELLVQPSQKAGHPPRSSQRQTAPPRGRDNHSGRDSALAVTVATNMAGRGVDIILGGNPEGMARRDVLAEQLDP